MLIFLNLLNLINFNKQNKIEDNEKLTTILKTANILKKPLFFSFFIFFFFFLN